MTYTNSRRTITTPGGSVSNLCVDILKQPHVLIAGCTGSGKSVLINSIIHTILHFSPTDKQVVLIDPKKVELFQYRDLIHCIGYASETSEAITMLSRVGDLMMQRFDEMQSNGQKESTEPHIYVIIDEFADLMTTAKKETTVTLCRIAQLGRAAHIHLILATQRPTREIVTGQIKVNFDCRVALRCPTAQDSRNIINTSGAEMLPRYGQALYLTPETMKPIKVNVPFTPEDEISRVINHWLMQV